MRGTDITWEGGEHTFLLNIALLRALQVKCDAGPQHILQRLSDGRWMVDDVIAPIRLGLEGGGLSKDEARVLVQRHVEDLPLTMSVITARTVLMAALFGVDDDTPGEPKAGEEMTQTRDREESGNSPQSTSGQESSIATSEK